MTTSLPAAKGSAPTDLNPRKGLLLLNLGTPDSPEPEDVGRYLREFLMDKWVVDIPALFRWFLVNVMIVPKRKFASSEAYHTIWTERGSPLSFHLQDLAKGVSTQLGGEFEVATGMRYGNPSIHKALSELQAKGVDEIIVFQLYPQYAESTTRSSEEKCLEVARKLGLKARLRFYPPFYDHPEFIDCYASLVGPALKGMSAAEGPEHLLMSFHGVPERHVKRTDRSGGRHCLASQDCCAQITDVNRDCYRAQCFATARALASRLGLRRDQYTVSFQSRLGRTPWIRPYTDDILYELASRGVKRLAVVCPSFAADCLETIEEIGDRGGETFKHAGGVSYHVLPCLNADPRWSEAVARLVRDHQK